MFIADPADPGTWPRTRKPSMGLRRNRYYWQAQWDKDLQRDPDVCDYDPQGHSLGIKWLTQVSRRPGKCPWCKLRSPKPGQEDRDGLFPYDIHGVTVWLCCWHCCAQLRKHRAVRARELDTLIAMGHLPAKIPAWYLPPDTLLSLIAAAQHHQALRSNNERPSKQEA